MKVFLLVPMVMSVILVGCMGGQTQGPIAAQKPMMGSGSGMSAKTDVPATFTLADVALKNTPEDCYTAIEGKVYSLTEWIARHPGGSEAIIGLCGKDGTAAFGAQHGGSGKPQSMLNRYEIGTLVDTK